MSSIATNNALASEAGAAAAHLDKPAVNPEVAAQDVSSTQKAAAQSIQERYASERAKRMRTEGNAQFIDLSQSEKYRYLAGDCWVDADSTPRLELQNDMHAKVFIVGGGFGGLVYAVRMIQAGINPQDIIIADAAGGYGGTWYWNRYPGLMCDVESYIYLPLLEETGYMPKHKYSYGSEIREYANRIAKQWDLEDRGAFQQSVQNLDWDDDRNYWRVQSQDLKTRQVIQLTAEFVVIAPGLLHNPKLSDFNGIDEYKGQAFHTARWNYDATGGSPDDPSLTKLKGKRVGIIGTGATAIQAVPHLARWAKELYIFQRTPSSVDRRDQRETDPEEFAQITSTQNWQWERTKNFNSFLNNVPNLPEKDLVNDGWTNFPSYNTLLGTPKKITIETIADHIASNHALDIPRQTYIRNRVSRLVHNQTTASNLKPWYSGWCKRPCFHDEYLQTFNLPHVKLIDTDGRGITHLSPTGIIANSTTYPLDIIVFSTGYSIEATVSPTRRANITTHGRHGTSLDEKWNSSVATLHGLLTHDFPNLFFSGPTQTTASANFSSCLDLLARQAAYIISTAQQQANSDTVVVEPTVDAEEAWAQRIAARAIVFAGVAGCTPSYLNGEGQSDGLSREEQVKRARMSMWGGGMNEYADILEGWREEGGLEGLVVTAV